MTVALRLSEIMEAQADAALLALFKLRDAFVLADDHHAASSIDEAMELVQAVCREKVS